MINFWCTPSAFYFRSVHAVCTTHSSITFPRTKNWHEKNGIGTWLKLKTNSFWVPRCSTPPGVSEVGAVLEGPLTGGSHYYGHRARPPATTHPSGALWKWQLFSWPTDAPDHSAALACTFPLARHQHGTEQCNVCAMLLLENFQEFDSVQTVEIAHAFIHL